MAKRRNNATRLRNAVDALPRHTAEAMLRAIDDNRIIVGAYTDKRGGVCPMLGAHRCGGRTNFGTFARAWDAYTGADKAKKSRSATTREVNTLRSYLEQAVMGEDWRDVSLGGAVDEVRASRRRSSEIEAREGDGLTIEQMLAETYAEAEERRSERRADEILAEPTERTPFQGIAEQLERVAIHSDD